MKNCFFKILTILLLNTTACIQFSFLKKNFVAQQFLDKFCVVFKNSQGTSLAIHLDETAIENESFSLDFKNFQGFVRNSEKVNCIFVFPEIAKKETLVLDNSIYHSFDSESDSFSSSQATFVDHGEDYLNPEEYFNFEPIKQAFCKIFEITIEENVEELLTEFLKKYQQAYFELKQNI